MSSTDKWEPSTAANMIMQNGGRVDGKVIKHKSPGLKVLSAIDYLVNNHKYIWKKGE